ncbi:MAG: hypothetical protein J1G05_03940 [Clostridiales bacterium]|nr:hypothetical protein [Clostridiales bacterium]
MNLLETNGITGIFTDWAIALFIFFAILILLAVLFKGLKVGILLVSIAAVVAGIAVLAAFVVMLISWDILLLIDFAIKWGPTILFVTILTVSTLVNAKRGLRKSLILLAQAVGACIVCTVFFYVCVTSEEVDKAILSIVNQMLGGSTLQGMLGVSENCKTIREIIAEWLPNVIGGDMKILLAANPEYIVTLVDMVFRIIFSVITVILYFLLVFLLYIVYFFAYPERRYKKKIKKAVEKNQTDRTYKKHHVGGGAVGLVRGVTVGLLTLSFMGSALFMVAGGLGQGTLGDYDFENDDYNFYYSIYRSVESYGSQGIFKVLNSMTDPSDTPFYLFAADMVLSGNLDDEDNGINDQTIKFREEIAAYVGFAKDALNLLMKYGEADMADILNGNGGSNSFDKIVNIMSIPEFRAEFNALIKEFDTQTYIVNLGMSLITTVVENLDEISFTSSLDNDNKELLKILFKKDYLSDTIPDESELKQQLEAGIISPSEVSRPRLKVNHILSKEDISIALEVTFSILSGDQETKDTLGLIKSILPEIKQLSIFKSSNAGELDPVLARLYCYYGNKYLTAEGEAGITYSSVAGKNIKWLDELNILMDITGDALTLWGNIYKSGKQPLDILISLFDANDPNYEKNSQYFKNIRSALERSEIIGTVMSTSFMTGMMKDALAAISENVYIPENIAYTRKVDADGNVVDEGELHKLFSGFMLLASAQDGSFLDEILSIAGGENEVDIGAILSSLSDALSSVDNDGKNLSYYLTESQLLRSLISSVMIDMGSGMIYVPNVALEKLANGESVNMITKSELKSLFDNLGGLIEFVKPILEGGDITENIGEIVEYIQTEEFDNLLANSRICEGTVAHFLMDFLSDNEFTVIPTSLAESIDGWVTVNGKKGELRNLLSALNATSLDFAQIVQGEFDTNSLLDAFLSMDGSAIQNILDSQVLHYTISNFLINGLETGGFEIIVPYSARELTKEGDSLEYLVKKSEILSLFDVIGRIELSGEADISDILYKLIVNKDIFDSSRIIAASIVYTIVNNEDISSAITIPEAYSKAGSKSSLLDYNSSNVWKAELPRFIDALDEILGISKAGEDFVFDPDSIIENLSGFLTELNESSSVNPEITKLELCYRSDIVWHEINIRLDEILLGNGIVPEDVIAEVKVRGSYKLEEIQALSSALDIFGLDDLLNADSDAIVESVTGMALKLNDPLEKYDGDTALEVIYRSQIIQYIFSNQIDTALDGNIDSSVLGYIKKGSRNYALNDVAAFIDAIKELGIEDFSNMEGFSLSDIGNLNDESSLDPEKTRLDVIYNSLIIAGVITKNLYDGLNSGSISDKEIDHPKAYETDVAIYRIDEIESIFSLFENIGDIDEDYEFDINSVDLVKASERLYDENGDTHSYLIAVTISVVLLDNEDFIIPVSVLDEYECILPQELARVLNVFVVLSDGQDIDDLENFEITEIPQDEKVREDLYSSEILRARITYDLGEQSSGQSVYITNEYRYIRTAVDTNGITRWIITYDELKSLVEALDYIQNDEAESVFEIPKFTIDDILGYDKDTLEKLLQSDILSYKISECMLKERMVLTYLSAYGILPEEKRPIDLSTGGFVEENIEVISRNTILGAYEYIKAMQQF